MRSLVLRIVKQMLHDKRSLALILFAPLLILTLLYFLLGTSSYQPVIAAQKLPEPILSQLEKQDIVLIRADDITDIDQYLKEKHADAVLSMSGSELSIQMLEGDSIKTVKVTDAVKNAMQAVSGQSQMKVTFVYGDTNTSTFDSLGFMLLGILSFFFVFMISGVSFVRERTSGTLERLMLTPIRRSSVVLGYTMGFGLFAALQSVLVVLFTKFVLHMEFNGSWWLVLLTMLLLAFVAVSLGTFVSIFANNEFQVVQFIPIIIIPQIFFAGIIPIDTLPFGLSILAYIMPVYYGSMGLKEVLVYGNAFSGIWWYLLMLCGFIIALFFANILALKKYRAL